MLKFAALVWLAASLTAVSILSVIMLAEDVELIPMQEAEKRVDTAISAKDVDVTTTAKAVRRLRT
jgi:hypothetical protein